MKYNDGKRLREQAIGGIRCLAIASTLVLTLGLLSTTDAIGQQPSTEGRSPAQGHAAVIAQGVEPLPRVPVAWRVVTNTARMPNEALTAERTLSFVLAEEGPLLLTDEATGRRVHLSTAEASFTPQGARQQRASAADAPVSYYALELIVAEVAQEPATIGNGTLIFASEPFIAPSGDRDLDLVRDVLDRGESSFIAASDAPILILATDSMLRVIPSVGPDETLRAGEAGVYTGDIEIQAGREAGTSFVAAVIGRDVLPQAARAMAPTQSNEPRSLTNEGMVFVGVAVCPGGMTLETLDPGACTPVTYGVDFSLTSDVLTRTLSLADASTAQLFAQVQWQGLPYGNYVLTQTEFLGGYDSAYAYYDETNVTPLGEGTSYAITLDRNTPAGGVNIYYFLSGANLNPTQIDTDGDGLSDVYEVEIGTLLDNPDTDGDGLTDGEEILIFGTDPRAQDTDGDGFTDYDELFIHGTDPNDPLDFPVIPQ